MAKRTPVRGDSNLGNASAGQLKRAVNEWLDAARVAAGLATWGKVAAIAGLPPSTITAIRQSGKMSVKVAKQLAGALRPRESNLRDFTAELFAVAGLDPTRLGVESIADRVRRTRTIRAGYIVSEPFVLTPEKQRDPSGFAVELFGDVAALLDASVDYAPAPIEFGGLAPALARGDYDIVVSAVLRTYRREAVMAFSAPFPFLRVPLSAIVRRDVNLDWLTVGMLVDWAAVSRGHAELRALRFLLVESEAGDEFVRAFMSRTGNTPEIRRVNTLEPDVLLTELLQRDVLIADMATCAAVIARNPAAVKGVSPDANDPVNAGIASPAAFGHLSALAVYQLGFALPRDQPEWKAMVDGAMQALLLEGLRPLTYLYQRYLDAPRYLRRFSYPRDEEVRFELVRKVFETLLRPTMAYRTPGLPRGVFSVPGNIHVHVDGGGDAKFVERLLRSLEPRGARGKVTQIIAAVSGAQRALLPETYASHTPGSGGLEHFEYFSTINAGSREQAIELLRLLLPEVLRRPGLVVEVERVVARVNESGRLVSANLAPIERLTMADVNATPSPTLAFEIHHAFDVRDDVPVPALSDLALDAAAAGLAVGGWFHFAKGNLVAYRSNAFSDGHQLTEVVEREHAALQQYLVDCGLEIRVRTVVEEVLGIWHSV